MRTHTFRGSRALARAAVLTLIAACADTPTTPSAPLLATSHVTLASAESGFEVLNLHLRPADDSESGAWGQLTVFVGTLVPPNPCLTTVEIATVAVCGVIHNPGEELLTGGALIVQASPDARPVTLELTLPPNPCLTYRIVAAATPDLGTTDVSLPAVQAVFTFEQGTIVESQPGPPNDPSASIGTAPGPPDAPPNPCLVGLDVRQGE
jgi:hypothetical protein